MDKSKLVKFINKYYLSGNVNSVAINSDGNGLSTRFVSGDKSLLGEVKLKNYSITEADFGVYQTDVLLKMLSVLDNDVSVDLVKAEEKAISLDAKDSGAKVRYMLSDLSVINTPPQLKQIPEFELLLNVDKTFVSKFISGKGALPDTESFTIVSGDKPEVIIGYSSIATNRVAVPVENQTDNTIDNISFNANLFKDVLEANKECEAAVLEVSSEGLARITFNVGDYESTYYLVAVQNVN
jgi:ribosome maturation factor RimP|tara:strand:+ start:956 stop:1672 length:717 start_codon:yes stop_codon:yes gene_type:complete